MITGIKCSLGHIMFLFSVAFPIVIDYQEDWWCLSTSHLLCRQPVRKRVPKREWLEKKESKCLLGHCFSNVYDHMTLLGILLKCRFWCSRLERCNWWEFVFITSSKVILILLIHKLTLSSKTLKHQNRENIL